MCLKEKRKQRGIVGLWACSVFPRLIFNRIFAWEMGICVSKRIAESPKNAGRSSSRMVSRDGIQLSQSSSKAFTTSYLPTPRSEGEILQSPNVKSFTFGDLKAATRNFRPDSVIGEGGFGSVFKGWLDEYSLAPSKPGSNMVVAVKRLKHDSWQGHSEWLAEINYLGQLQHPNLVKLIGYCLQDDHRLLVYEYMQKGSLENHLFRRGSYFQPLNWSLRMKIAIGAAKGLAFLHSAETKVIYRDFKTSNILLDLDYNAKLSDFGLARDGPADDKSHVSTRVMGTYGYAAPEYLSTGHLTAKSDVYSFGVVLLEIVTGKKAIDKNRPTGEQSLVEWARPYLTNKRRVLSIVDARLEGQYSITMVAKTSLLALQCLSLDPRSRPTMDEIVKFLEDLHESKGSSSARGKKKSQSNQANNGLESKETKAISTSTSTTYPRPSASLHA